MAQPLALDDVLALKHPGRFRWSPNGRALAFIWSHLGDDHLWLAEIATGFLAQLSTRPGCVTEFDWHPRGDAIAYVQDDDVWVWRSAATGPSPLRVAQTPGREWLPRWSPDGSLLAFAREDGVWTWSPADGTLRAYALPGPLAAETTTGTQTFRWAPDGAAMACVFADADERGWDLAVLRVADGKVVWRTHTVEPEGHAVWIDARRLVYSVALDLHRRREHYLVGLIGPLSRGTAGGAAPVGARPRLLHTESDPRGLIFGVEPQVAPDGRALLIVLRHTGWEHLYALDVESGALRQLTDGTCDDTGHGFDLPQWSPDGRRVLFASNRTDPGQRQLWTVEVADGRLRQLTHTPGSAVQGLWASDGSRIAYLYSGPADPPDLWVVDADGTAPYRLTRSLPETWTADHHAQPRAVTFASVKDWTIHGYLYLPPGLEPDRRHPALVWVHGGPMRQAVFGWHPSYGDALFHAFSLYLASRGVVTLAVNYRGGVGYGVAFEQGNYLALGADDTADVAAAGRFLKTLPYVDPGRVGVWGISYGGRLTMAALTKHPDVFALGIEIAGVWNESRKTAWAERRYPVAAAYFKARLGGYEDERPDVWREASPGLWVHQMRAPLVAFHGTRDASVPFSQFDEMVQDCVRAGKMFEAHYYPDETHVFTFRQTWADVFRKIEHALDRYLRLGG
ncbi:MAG: prolyl oligopeptidase family serine peptidase [Armatimonadota bacterium]|nr:prolyl oligopeptidase family serine peptidase [Armatimonadota bacterium]